MKGTTARLRLEPVDGPKLEPIHLEESENLTNASAVQLIHRPGTNIRPIRTRDLVQKSLVLHGLLPHWSGINRSATSRHAYSLHCISATAEYPDWNWLQRPSDMPLRRLRDRSVNIS